MYSSRMRAVAIVTLAAGALSLAGLFAMPRALASGDEGVKLIEAQSLWASGFRSRALTYPAAQMDPEGRFFPLRPPFVFRREGRFYGLYPLPFVAVSAVGWRVAGFRGIFLLPWLAAVASVALAGLLARRALDDRWAAVVAAATALATPLLIYGLLHWEHSLAVAMLLGALVLAAEPTVPRLLLAGVLVGAGPAIRTELYCVPLAFIAFTALAWRPRDGWRLVIAGAAGLATAGAFWLWNQRALGMWDPVVVINRAFLRQQPAKWDGLALLFPHVRSVALLGALALVGGFLSGRLRLAAVLACSVWAAVLSLHEVVTARPIAGLFASSPLALLGFLHGPRRSLAGACAAAGVVLVAAMLATDLARIGGGGLQFGSRYLLPAAPLLLIGAIALVRESPRLVGPAAAALCAISCVATILNVRACAHLRKSNARLSAAVEHSGARDVVAIFFWVPQVLAPLWPDHRIYAWSDHILLKRLVESGVTRIVRIHGGIPDYHEGVMVAPIDAPHEDVVVYSLARADEP
jgi:hypothetical protein